MTDDIISFTSDQEDLTSGAPMVEDRDPDILSLRPESLSDYVGQKEVVATLKIAIEASLQRQ